jgi:hypothetical protein
MTTRTPPAAFDRFATERARGIAALKLDAMPAARRTAIIHEAIVAAMMMARESALDAVGNELIEAGHGEAYEIVYRAMKGAPC